MDSSTTRRLIWSLAISMLAWQACFASREMIQEFLNQVRSGQPGTNDTMRMIRMVMSGLMTAGEQIASRMTSSSSDPRGVHDMVNDGLTQGMNVLSGLVKIDRVREPGKPRALSVRVFGVPVFSRGFNRGDPMPTDLDNSAEREADSEPAGEGSDAGSANDVEEEELPLDP